MARFLLVTADGTVDNVIVHQPDLAPAAQDLAEELWKKVEEAGIQYARLVAAHHQAEAMVVHYTYEPPEGTVMVPAEGDYADVGPGDTIHADGKVTKAVAAEPAATVEDRLAALEASATP